MIDMDLPGAEIVAAGLDDIQAGRVTAESLAVKVVALRLQSLGIAVENDAADAELVLYAFLCDSGHVDAYSRYNALLRRLDSFSSALEHRRRWERISS